MIKKSLNFKPNKRKTFSYNVSRMNCIHCVTSTLVHVGKKFRSDYMHY